MLLAQLVDFAFNDQGQLGRLAVDALFVAEQIEVARVAEVGPIYGGAAVEELAQDKVPGLFGAAPPWNLVALELGDHAEHVAELGAEGKLVEAQLAVAGGVLNKHLILFDLV